MLFRKSLEMLIRETQQHERCKEASEYWDEAVNTSRAITKNRLGSAETFLFDGREVGFRCFKISRGIEMLTCGCLRMIRGVGMQTPLRRFMRGAVSDSERSTRNIFTLREGIMRFIHDLSRFERSQPISFTRRFSAMGLLIGILATGVALTTNSFGDGGSSGSGSSGSGSSGGAKPLSSVKVPMPADLGTYVKDKQAAIMLGKALFWDTQTGGTGNQGCASCHYNAGVDNRTGQTTLAGGHNGIVDTTYSVASFPFKALQQDDIVGSQGVPARDFKGLNYGQAKDDCDGSNDTLQVTGRNAPNAIMAIFNRDSFWDGRAAMEFNGVTPFGKFTDPSKSAPSTAKIWVNGPAGLYQQAVIISPASAASQAVGPANNQVEMSCKGRTWGHLGRKMLNNGLMPFGNQYVHGTDSVLGVYSNWPNKGMNRSYKDMVRAAFNDQFTSDLPLPDGSGFTQIEQNFSLYWGLSIMLWEGILLPDQTPFDKWASGKGTLTAQQLMGQQVFNGNGRCIQCHSGAEFANSSINIGGDRAFTNSAIRADLEDGGRQPENLSKFKVPTIRNVELTGPYFHTGGYLTLRQVVDFYDRGGNFPGSNTDSQIRPLGLTSTEKDALVAFMLALTDERTRCEKAPFDHPSIDIPAGPSIAAVGSAGRPAGQCQTPYLNLNPFQP